MLIGEPSGSSGDINFHIFGVPIRVTPWFWFVVGMLGWGGSQIEDQLTGVVRVDPPLLFSWIAAAFISILIHELGHAFAFRYYGIESHIVLYQLGGLAIPHSASGMRARTPWSQIMISAAGPAAQLLTAIALSVILIASHHSVPLGGFVGERLPLPDYPLIQPFNLLMFTVHFLYVSVYWALLNLLPIYPLDGGQIARQLFVLFGRSDAVKTSLMTSFAVAALMAVYSLGEQDMYMAIMFGLLAYSSYQALQPFLSGGGPFGRRW